MTTLYGERKKLCNFMMKSKSLSHLESEVMELPVEEGKVECRLEDHLEEMEGMVDQYFLLLPKMRIH